MNEPQRVAELTALADHLTARRDAILAAWCSAVETDPKLSELSILSRGQFTDHIPAVLNALERDLRAGIAESAEAAEEHKECAAEHARQRWQHGHKQEQIMREWGHLHICLVRELENYASTHPNSEMSAMRRARLMLARLCSDGVIESAATYARLQQAEADGRLRDVEAALAHVQEMERERAKAWHEAAHDLRNKVSVVHGVTDILNSVPEEVQAEYLTTLQESVASLRALLNDLTILSRLEAGHERQNIESLDVAKMLRDVHAAMLPIARERNLFLQSGGPGTLPVKGDAVKIRRIAENLLLNALKYTQHGGVTMTWAALDLGGIERWELCVHDTGPGFQIGSVTPLAGVSKETTKEAQTLEKGPEKIISSGNHTQASAGRQVTEPPGEGIGLSIVRRICELLDASLEVETESGKGSTFRVIFPQHYATR
jgi:signal transduction histidine kinase